MTIKGFKLIIYCSLYFNKITNIIAGIPELIYLKVITFKANKIKCKNNFKNID